MFSELRYVRNIFSVFLGWMIGWLLDSDLKSCQEGCALHDILPRTLQRLSESTMQSNLHDQKVAEILQALSDAQVQPDSSDEEDGSHQTRRNDEKSWASILLKHVGEDKDDSQSYAQVNTKRKLLTFQAFRDSTISQKPIALDSLLRPNVAMMNVLFRRTEILSAIAKHVFETASLDKLDEMKKKFLVCLCVTRFCLAIRFVHCLPSHSCTPVQYLRQDNQR